MAFLLNHLLLLLLLASPTLDAVVFKCSAADRRALLAIKSAFTSTNYFASWTESDPYCCHWKGVGCNPLFSVSGLFVINDSSLVGEIPAAVGDLANVFVIEFYNLPGLTGSIPSSLANLRRLVLLNLHHNSLSGSIPAMPSLRYLNLSFNRFEFVLGSVDLGMNLTVLDMSHNRITGSIPAQVNQMLGLTKLDLSHNRLCGQIPTGPVTSRFGSEAYSDNGCLCGAPLPACL
ncbi:hypothetical protein HPP92_015471 [Vanilla planifolia]|uniref:Leucine-rich repeat-containing N-terminal plant-type domain-containing protein n=1 Tax=Vanilla planifolia TaxID=51239 RepID=A0A835QJ84_VANPL|nr:hypothetical protein HPP92_015471 [Vanilla planifolia]